MPSCRATASSGATSDRFRDLAFLHKRIVKPCAFEFGEARSTVNESRYRSLRRTLRDLRNGVGRRATAGEAESGEFHRSRQDIMRQEPGVVFVATLVGSPEYGGIGDGIIDDRDAVFPHLLL